MSETVLTFTIHETLFHDVSTEDGKSARLETWIVDDEFIDSEAFRKVAPHQMIFARLLNLELIKELHLEEFIKNKDAEGVAAIRKSVFDFGSSYDIECLIKHEAGHLLLGHKGENLIEEEKQVRDLIGDAEISNDLFGQRYIDFIDGKI